MHDEEEQPRSQRGSFIVELRVRRLIKPFQRGIIIRRRPNAYNGTGDLAILVPLYNNTVIVPFYNNTAVAQFYNTTLKFVANFAALFDGLLLSIMMIHLSSWSNTAIALFTIIINLNRLALITV